MPEGLRTRLAEGGFCGQLCFVATHTDVLARIRADIRLLCCCACLVLCCSLSFLRGGKGEGEAVVLCCLNSAPFRLSCCRHPPLSFRYPCPRIRSVRLAPPQVRSEVADNLRLPDDATAEEAALARNEYTKALGASASAVAVVMGAFVVVSALLPASASIHRTRHWGGCALRVAAAALVLWERH